MCHVSGLLQNTQRSPQPWTKTRKRTPGPSTAEKDSMEWTEPTTSGTWSGAVGRGAVAKSKAAGRCRRSAGCGAGAGSAAELQAAAEAAKPRFSSCRAPTAAAGASDGAKPPLSSESIS
jgi:hypothetical protein